MTQEAQDRAAEEFERLFVQLVQRIGYEKAELVRDIAFRTGVERAKEITLLERPALPKDGHVPPLDDYSKVLRLTYSVDLTRREIEDLEALSSRPGA